MCPPSLSGQADLALLPAQVKFHVPGRPPSSGPPVLVVDGPVHHWSQLAKSPHLPASRLYAATTAFLATSSPPAYTASLLAHHNLLGAHAALDLGQVFKHEGDQEGGVLRHV